jgi:hypothetical protein
MLSDTGNDSPFLRRDESQGSFYLVHIYDPTGEGADGPMTFSEAVLHRKYMPTQQILSAEQLADLRGHPRAITVVEVIRNIEEVTAGWGAESYMPYIQVVFPDFNTLGAAMLGVFVYTIMGDVEHATEELGNAIVGLEAFLTKQASKLSVPTQLGLVNLLTMMREARKRLPVIEESWSDKFNSSLKMSLQGILADTILSGACT